jgi:hypothetical protein
MLECGKLEPEKEEKRNITAITAHKYLRFSGTPTCIE